jgi:hypothetical protein
MGHPVCWYQSQPDQPHNPDTSTSHTKQSQQIPESWGRNLANKTEASAQPNLKLSSTHIRHLQPTQCSHNKQTRGLCFLIGIKDQILELKWPITLLSLASRAFLYSILDWGWYLTANKKIEKHIVFCFFLVWLIFPLRIHINQRLFTVNTKILLALKAFSWTLCSAPTETKP